MYVGLKLCPWHSAELERWTRSLPVSRIIPASKLHLTIYRNRRSDGVFAGVEQFDPPRDVPLLHLKLKRFQIGSGGTALAFTFMAPWISKRHNAVAAALGFPRQRKFVPHVSVCYDAEALTKNQIKAAKASFPLKELRLTGEESYPNRVTFASEIV